MIEINIQTREKLRKNTKINAFVKLRLLQNQRQFVWINSASLCQTEHPLETTHSVDSKVYW